MMRRSLKSTDLLAARLERAVCALERIVNALEVYPATSDKPAMKSIEEYLEPAPTNGLNPTTVPPVWLASPLVQTPWAESSDAS